VVMWRSTLAMSTRVATLRTFCPNTGVSPATSARTSTVARRRSWYFLCCGLPMISSIYPSEILDRYAEPASSTRFGARSVEAGRLSCARVAYGPGLRERILHLPCVVTPLRNAASGLEIGPARAVAVVVGALVDRYLPELLGGRREVLDGLLPERLALLGGRHRGIAHDAADVPACPPVHEGEGSSLLEVEEEELRA